MARFDVYRASSGTLLLDCQNDFLMDIETRLVAPLLPMAQVDWAMRRLTPVFHVDDVELVMMTPLLVGVPKRELGKRIASLADEQDVIMSAIDMLLSGF